MHDCRRKFRQKYLTRNLCKFSVRGGNEIFVFFIPEVPESYPTFSFVVPEEKLGVSVPGAEVLCIPVALNVKVVGNSFVLIPLKYREIFCDGNDGNVTSKSGNIRCI